MFRSRPVSLALVGVFLWLTGCTTWQRIEIADVPDYSLVRVISTDGAELQFRDPELASDTLRGRLGESTKLGGYRWSDSVTAIHVEHVAEVEAQQSTGPGTALLVVVGFAALVLVGLSLAMGPYEW